MSARGLQHRTTGLRARRAPIRADFQKIENPLVHSKLVRVPGYPGWPLFPFRFDRGRGAIEKAVRTSMVAARDSGSTRGNPRIDRQRRAAVDKQPRIPTYPALYPKLKFDFPHWTFPLPLLLEQAVGRGSKRVRFSRGRFKILSLSF